MPGLSGVEIQMSRLKPQGRVGLDDLAQVLAFDMGGLQDGQKTFRDVADFADVARPGVGLQKLAGFPGYGHLVLFQKIVLVQIMQQDGDDVALP